MFAREEIKTIIPHREPFLFLDRVTHLQPGLSGKGIYRVDPRGGWVEGHFPDYPIFPGVLQLEAVAQLGSVVVLSPQERRGMLAFFTGIDKVRFRRQVLPEDVMELSVELNRLRRNFGSGKGIAKVDGKIVLQAQINYILGEPDEGG